MSFYRFLFRTRCSTCKAFKGQEFNIIQTLYHECLIIIFYFSFRVVYPSKYILYILFYFERP